ncbi:MAG: hypothetical protein ABSG87_09650, partial [Verrucomicrobiota bacterium]
MNTKQLNKLTMYLAVEGICDGNTTVWQPLQGFADAYADLKTHVTGIQTLAQSQSLNNTGIAVDKHAARAAMCNAAFPISSAIHAYAIKTKNNQLVAQVNFSISDLMSGQAPESVTRCQNIYDTANTNLASLANYGVTAAKMTAFNGAIAAFNLLISAPRDARASGKTTTGQLGGEFDAADEALMQMDDLIGQFQSGNPKFVGDYLNARAI